VQFEKDYFMKSFSIASLGAIAVIAATPFVAQMPVLANLQTSGTAIAQNLQRQAPVQMSLAAAKQVMQKDAQGKEQVMWQPLQGKATVQPGDVIRYTVKGENSSDSPVRNLAFTQPIPKQTVYVLNSATVGQNAGARITYSINNGKTFVEKPMVQVKLPDGKVEMRPAPAEAYTHVRWNFGSSVNPKTMMAASYQVRVQ
jgi:uncharacterized repeat protein (TIGR01451 family)